MYKSNLPVNVMLFQPKLLLVIFITGQCLNAYQVLPNKDNLSSAHQFENYE